MSAYPELADRQAYAPRRARHYRFAAAMQFPPLKHDPNAPLTKVLDSGRNAAACKIDPEPDQWFTSMGGDRLQRVCRGCPIVQACGDYALHNDVKGFWAGTTYHQRELIRKRMGIVAQKLPSAKTPVPAPATSSVERETWA